MLFYGCCQLDIDWVKMAVKKGANVNALNDRGECALTLTIEFFEDSSIRWDDNLTDEEYENRRCANYNKCLEIVDYLLECGADIDLFGVDGMQPIASAYYTHSVDLVRHLLEKGSDPNYNSYRCDDLRGRTEDDCQCTILKVIYDDMDYEYDDTEKEIEMLVHNYGGHVYSWDLDVARQEHIGRFYMRISPRHETYLFFDNAGWGIGNEDEITIRDKDDNLQTLKLSDIEGLRQWHKEYLDNKGNPGYDWQAWNVRGRDLCQKLAKQLPDSVALFYPFAEQIECEHDKWSNEFYLKFLWEKVLIV